MKITSADIGKLVEWVDFDTIKVNGVDIDDIVSGTTPRTNEPTDTLRRDLARTFGLAPDAPDEVLLSTARKAWGGITDETERLRKAAMDVGVDFALMNRKRALLADKCGDLEYENKRLRAMLGRRLVDDLDVGSVWSCAKCHTNITGKCVQTVSGPMHPECACGREER